MLLKKTPGFGLQESQHIAAFDVILILIVFLGRKRALISLLGEKLDSSHQVGVETKRCDSFRNLRSEASGDRVEESVECAGCCHTAYCTLIWRRK
jgi:hypothetical protein